MNMDWAKFSILGTMACLIIIILLSVFQIFRNYFKKLKEIEDEDY